MEWIWMDNPLLWKELNPMVLVAGIVIQVVTLIEIVLVSVAGAGILVVADEVQMVVTVLNVGSLVILQENALLVMVQEEIGIVAEMTGMGVVMAVIIDMDLTGMGTASLHETEMEEAMGAQEVIDIIAIGLVHMIGLVEVAAATELDHIASVTGCCCLAASGHGLSQMLMLL
ncbi:hypothetical protein MUK42_17451 [Musa troglodytarum]|uniref:Uncharacterized protein n=1 Tax=Musa troglodytarum TaxID=320322 RepID=A0A9E7H991_9LILI|nr:hypothetical protein MUK42_17451 [Musa troglodytarum]